VPYVLRHGTSVFKVACISERPVVLSSECRVLDEGTVTPYFIKRLRFDTAIQVIITGISYIKRRSHVVAGVASKAIKTKHTLTLWPFTFKDMLMAKLV
jgi:hypothetical protein